MATPFSNSSSAFGNDIPALNSVTVNNSSNHEDSATSDTEDVAVDFICKDEIELFNSLNWTVNSLDLAVNSFT